MDFDCILKFSRKLAQKFVFTADWLCLGRHILQCVHHRKHEHLSHLCLKNPEVDKGHMEDLELRYEARRGAEGRPPITVELSERYMK